ncbi:helix-turn-helix domain-containing protein [Saccharopolyspora taberi]|uniref:Helix-turn-helix transcriptional regulator n=1 Tax=Saccharopolyspora taberi TaxID=60895 RepID=A0ABN3V6P2_9PSEU
MARYQERAPRPELAGPVTCVWTHESASGHEQRIIPDGCVDLIWIGGRLELAGPDSGPRLVDLPPGTAAGGVRMRPGAAGLLLGATPTSELLDDQVPLPEVWGSRATGLLDRLHATTTAPESALVLEDLALRLLPRFARDPAIDAAVAALAGLRPPPVPGLADALGLSERQLRRRFTAAVGYGPKTLAAVLRLRRALRLGAGGGLADLAAAAGYADQAHMTREFRRLAGLPPAALLSSW